MFKNFNIFRLPYAVLAIIIGTLLSRFGTAMILPYVTILLVHQKHLALSWAGIAIGVSYLAQAFGASLSGRILASLESFLLIKMATYVYSLTFIIMGLLSIYVDTPWIVGCGFILCFLIMGLCRSLIETTGQAIISHITPPAQKNFAFSLRYTFINIGTSLGPMIAILLGVLNTNIVFFVAAVFVSLYAIILKLTVHIQDSPHRNDQHKTFLDLLNILFLDKKLLYFILAIILSYIGFGQMETLFAYVAYHYTSNTHIFAVMYIINGISIVLLQIPLIKFIDEFDIHHVIVLGILFLVAGLIGVTASTVHPIMYYCSMFIFTLGEIFTLSLVGLYIDQIAAPENRHIYFGISNFSLIGKVLGPPLAVMLCEYLGLSTGLYLIAALTLLGVPCILLAKQVPVTAC